MLLCCEQSWISAYNCHVIEILLSYINYPKNTVRDFCNHKWLRKKRAESFEMFIQFHELLGITINSRGHWETIFCRFIARLSNPRNLFDTNDYAFMNFILVFFAVLSLSAIGWDTANCGSWALFAYFSFMFLVNAKMYKTIHNLCAQMNVVSYLFNLPINKPMRRAKESFKIFAYSFNFIIYFRTLLRLFPISAA